MRKLIFILLACTFAAAQTDFSKVEIKVQPVAGTVYMLIGAGGNIGVSVGDDGVVVVDDQYAPLAPKIEAALKGITNKPLRFILNTHWHGDHTGGNEHFGEIAPIIAQENVRKRLITGGSTRFGKVEPAPKGALPVITFEESVTVHLNGEDIRAIHFPNGHTDGDSVIFFPKSNVVHMGDDFFAARFPFVDLDSGGSVQGVIAGVETVLGEIPDDVKVIPGHGPLSDKTALRTYVTMLKDTLAGMQAALKKKMTLDAMKKNPAAVLGKYAASDWGKGFIKDDVWLEILYNSVTAVHGPNPKNKHGHMQ